LAVCVLFLVFLPVFLHAQAAEMDALLESPAITRAQAARFILEAAGALPEGLSPQEARETAVAIARDRAWLPKNAEPSAPASLEEVSLLVMGSFGLKGGIMYSLFHSPHFAYRELVYQKILQGRNDPALRLSGERLLRIIGRVLSLTEPEETGGIGLE
jgi:hypothetical protein